MSVILICMHYSIIEHKVSVDISYFGYLQTLLHEMVGLVTIPAAGANDSNVEFFHSASFEKWRCVAS